MPNSEPAPAQTGAAAARSRRAALAVATLAALSALSGCAGFPSAAARTAAPSTAAATPSTAAGHAAAGPAAVNLPVTSALRTELLSAAARFKHVPADDYSGLADGGTYYAYDPATRTYWAGARLVPRPDSTAAEVSVEDNGAYDLFRKTEGGPWRVHDVGLAGTSGSAGPCPVAIPPAVLRLWHWPAGACHPAPAT